MTEKIADNEFTPCCEKIIDVNKSYVLNVQELTTPDQSEGNSITCALSTPN